MLSESRISEITKRKDAATKGPWERGSEATKTSDYVYRDPGNSYTNGFCVWDDSDAEFIAHSITDVSDLLAEREELIRERLALREERNKRDTCVVCGGLLLEREEIPHCDDCVVPEHLEDEAEGE